MYNFLLSSIVYSEYLLQKIKFLVVLVSRPGLTPGSDSDSEECSSLERSLPRDDIYSRVQRRPTPHKKKSKAQRQLEGVTPPPIPIATDDRLQLLHADQLEKRRFSILLWFHVHEDYLFSPKNQNVKCNVGLKCNF